MPPQRGGLVLDTLVHLSLILTFRESHMGTALPTPLLSLRVKGMQMLTSQLMEGVSITIVITLVIHREAPNAETYYMHNRKVKKPNSILFITQIE